MSKRHSSDEGTPKEKSEKIDFHIKKKETEKGLAAKKPKLAFSIAKKPSLESSTNVSARNDKLKAAFNSDSEEEEELPPEARMRMRNIGRNTPTSAGPNSFGKTKHGFCDTKKVFEKTLKAAAEAINTEK